MAQMDGSWLLRLDGREVDSMDLTLEQVELAERVCNVPYTMLNPLASVKEAKALLVVMLVAGGATEDEALERVVKLPLRVLSGAFTWQAPDFPPSRPATGQADPPSAAPTSVAG